MMRLKSFLACLFLLILAGCSITPVRETVTQTPSKALLKIYPNLEEEVFPDLLGIFISYLTLVGQYYDVQTNNNALVNWFLTSPDKETNHGSN